MYRLFDNTPDEACCEECQFWIEADLAKRADKSHVKVGQCANFEDPRAPFADVIEGEAFVFTQPNARCEAFVPHPDVAADIAADRAHYDAMRRDRWVA